jgi:hypothetical protein
MNQKENKLIKNIEKKFTTIMIGALARFENNFGYLWDENSQNGDDFYNKWEKTRNEILNFGNNQLRLGVEELYEFFIYNKKIGSYHYKFDTKNSYNNTKQGDNQQ